MARHLIETDLSLITKCIQDKISAALADISSIHPDNLVTLETPSTESYFIYQKAHGYRCPAIFVEDGETDFRQAEWKSNFIDALATVYVTVKVEDYNMDLITLKAMRYQAALHEILDQTSLVSSDNAVSLKLRVKRIKPSGIYTYENSESSSTATFFKEYTLQLDVEHYENY
jgi:hypothetical protein